MAEILTLGPVAQGYCANCAEPRPVGMVSLLGWDFAAPVCGDCLVKLAKRLEARAENQTEEPKAKK